LVGFILYCCYNSSEEEASVSGGVSGTGDNANNPSGNTSSAPLMIMRRGANANDMSGRGGGSCSSSNRRIHREFHPGGLLPLTSCLYEEISQRNPDLPPESTQPQPALLTAHREQQLRQIKLEINALSCRLGIGQIYRGNMIQLTFGFGGVPILAVW
jgi:hypothetical protein